MNPGKAYLWTEKGKINYCILEEGEHKTDFSLLPEDISDVKTLINDLEKNNHEIRFYSPPDLDFGFYYKFGEIKEAVAKVAEEFGFKDTALTESISGMEGRPCYICEPAEKPEFPYPDNIEKIAIDHEKDITKNVNKYLASVYGEPESKISLIKEFLRRSSQKYKKTLQVDVHIVGSWNYRLDFKEKIARV